MRRRLLAALLLLTILSVAACDRRQSADPNPGVDLGDPDVGGGAGVETGPETPIPTATPTHEASPRLDATAAAVATFPPASPTLAPTAGLPPPTAGPLAPTEAAPVPSETPPPTVGPSPEPLPSPTAEGGLNEQGEIIHTVQPGENLYRIGLQYGISWVVIAEYNGITNPDAIAEGQEIRIPPATPQPSPTAEATPQSQLPLGQPVAAAGANVASGQTAPLPAAGDPVLVASDEASVADAARTAPVEDTHTVGIGDTLYGIARRYGLSWELVAEANGLAALNQIFAGQVLKIPVDIPGPTQEFAHQVRRGDTLAGIARQYGLTVTELAEANSLAEPYVIYPGQAITIPGE